MLQNPPTTVIYSQEVVQTMLMLCRLARFLLIPHEQRQLDTDWDVVELPIKLDSEILEIKTLYHQTWCERPFGPFTPHSGFRQLHTHTGNMCVSLHNRGRIDSRVQTNKRTFWLQRLTTDFSTKSRIVGITLALHCD